MRYIEGTGRNQPALWTLEEMVAEESIARVIDRYVEMSDLKKMGFTRTEAAGTGRPGYAAEPLIKLYIYGYQNAIRSSRKLEKECERNIEVMWMTEGVRPDYKTISEFRRENIRPLQKIFREFVKLCRTWEMVGGELFAIDGTKFKASNNKKNNFSRKKLEDRISRLDEKIKTYFTELDEEDSREETNNEVPEGIVQLFERKELYETYIEQLNETGENEVSSVDADARLMGNNRGGVEMAYNVQSTADAKNHIIVDYDVSMNPSDHGQLGNMTKRLIRQGYRRFTVLADKGYYNGKDLLKGKKYKIKAIVSRQEPSNPKEQPKDFHTDKFLYDRKTDTYLCPAGKTLHPHNKKTAERRNYYNKTACGTCPYIKICSSGQRNYRAVTRGKYSDIYEETDRIFRENKDIYKLRQQIAEHPFGTVKRTMDGGYFLLRSRRKVRCEIALLFLGYNLKRAVKVLGFKEIMARLDCLSSRIFQFVRLFSIFSSNLVIRFSDYFLFVVLSVA